MVLAVMAVFLTASKVATVFQAPTIIQAIFIVLEVIAITILIITIIHILLRL